MVRSRRSGTISRTTTSVVPAYMAASPQPQPPMWYSGMATRARVPSRISGASMRMPGMPLKRLSWVSMAPLGTPVVPLV